MKLEGFYYTILGIEHQEDAAIFQVGLWPDCDIYRGHFPGNPVCPGVCNMQMIKECAENLTGKRLHASKVKQCRLTALVTPTECPMLNVKIAIQSDDETHYVVKASIYDEQRTYMDYKGEMTV